MKIRISAGALLMFAALLMLLPLQWVLAAFLAAFVHEGFHYITVRLLGGKVREICIAGRGAVMDAGPMTPFQEFLCTLAGPIGSFSLLIVAKWMPRTAVCGLLHGAYNLLPLLPLDGGHILRCVLFSLLPPNRAQSLLTRLQKFFYLFGGLLLAALLFRVGTVVLIPVFFLLPRFLFGSTIGLLSRKRYGYDRKTKENPAHRAEACPVYRR